jgi:hypothetical protein
MAYSYTSAKPYTPPTVPGQAVQNNLLKALSTNAAGVNPTPPRPSDFSQGVEQADATNPNNTVYTPYQQASSTAAVDPNTHQSATTAPTGGSGGGGGGSGQNYNFDFSGDPILARIRALNAQNISQAEASALAQRKRAEIGYGYDPALQYEDSSTQEAAKQNPFSALAQLLFGHTQRAGNLDESLNKANLFYSGERGKQVGLEGRQYTLEQTNAQGNYQNTMDAIAQAVLQAKMQAQQQEVQAESDAYGRSINNALQYGGYGNAGGSSGGSGGLENAGQFGTVDPNQLQAAAQQYASGRSYNGSPYVPGQVMQEGQVETRNGVPGVYIKYRTAGGDSTEWTPVG